MRVKQRDTAHLARCAVAAAWLPVLRHNRHPPATRTPLSPANKHFANGIFQSAPFHGLSEASQQRGASGVFTSRDTWSFSGLTSKMPPLGSMLNFDADVKKMTARHQCEYCFRRQTSLDYDAECNAQERLVRPRLPSLSHSPLGLPSLSHCQPRFPALSQSRTSSPSLQALSRWIDLTPLVALITGSNTRCSSD